MRVRVAFGLLVIGASLAASCRTATQITLVISTDATCTELRGTSVTVGHLGEIETKAETTSSTFCDPSGKLGTLVVVPSGSKGDEVAMKVVGGFARDAESCVPPYGKGCIVARRAIHYLPHAGLRIQVPLRASCDGIACGESETCVAGACTPATIADPTACTGDTGCDESVLKPPPALDFADPARWTTFDVTSVNAGARNFWGTSFDGRWVYFVPFGDGNLGQSGLVTRYDTQAPYATAASWSVFDVTTLNPTAKGYVGGVFDGRFLYLVPNFPGGNLDDIAVRYDTQAPFGSATSWATLDFLTGVNGGTHGGFMGGAFDGRYVYFVPLDWAGFNGIVWRYDTQAPFGAGTSWSGFDMATVDGAARGYLGAVFDGRNVYFVPCKNPDPHGVIAKYDTQAAFLTGASWSTFDLTTVNAGAKDFQGGAFDGRYLYLIPYYNDAFDGLVARYDTQAPFAAAASWSTFDVTTVDPSAKGYVGATFDGRYLYFTPDQKPEFHGVVVRYDTQAPFGAAASWSTFDTTTLSPDAKGFGGAVFDGHYVHFAPASGTTAVRYEPKQPTTMPKLPGFSGSFL